MNRRGLLVLFGLTVFAVCGNVHAADKLDPNGTWKWSLNRSDQQPIEMTVKLKYDNGKLTGTATLPNKKNVTIDGASFTDGEVTFSITESGPKRTEIVTTYEGKLVGNTIQGKREVNHNSRLITLEWEAKR